MQFPHLKEKEISLDCMFLAFINAFPDFPSNLGNFLTFFLILLKNSNKVFKFYSLYNLLLNVMLAVVFFKLYIVILITFFKNFSKFF